MDRGEVIIALVRPLQVINVNKDAGGLVSVNIKVSNITKTLLTTILNAGGEIIFEPSHYKTLNAKIPLGTLEQIAISAEVLFNHPADIGITQAGL